MSFLNDIFGGETGKPVKGEKLYRRLCACGAVPQAAEELARQAGAPSETNHFIFDMALPILCRDDDDRIPVLRTILPALEKRRFAALTFRNIRLQVTDVFKKADLTLRALAFEGCSLSEQDWVSIPRKITGGGIREIAFKNISKRWDMKAMKAYPHPFMEGLLNVKGLEGLSFENCDLSDEDVSAIAGRLVESSSLKKLSIAKERARDKGVSDLISALPPTLEELNLSGMPLGGKNAANGLFDRLCVKIGEMPELRSLELAKCALETEDLKRLMAVLPPTMRRINLEDNEALDDKDVRRMAKYMRRPECFITEARFFHPLLMPKRFSAAVRQEIHTVQQINADALARHESRERKNAHARARGEKTFEEKLAAIPVRDIPGMLHDALKEGALEAALNRMEAGGVKLRPADMEARDEDGKSLAEACLESKMLPSLMKPERHESPRTYQAAYDALPESGKVLFDGKDGRPSFVKMKNTLMAEAVRAGLRNRSGGR